MTGARSGMAAEHVNQRLDNERQPSQRIRRGWATHARDAGLMSGGTFLVGAAGYAFIAVTGHTLTASDAAAVASFYLLMNIIGPGLFVALEQETNRATSSALASLVALRPEIRRAALHGLVLALIVIIALGLASPFLVARSLLGHWELFWALLAGTFSAAAVYLVRGVLGGLRRFEGYAVTLAGEGLMRLVPALAIALAGLASAGLFGFVFALGSAAGAVAALRWLNLDGKDGASDDYSRPEAAVRVRARGLASLVGATLLAQVVANLVPIVVTARLTDDAATAAAFACGFILARVPLFVFSPLQAVVVPAVARAAGRGERARIHQIVRGALAAATIVGFAGSALMFVVGPWAVYTLFGAKAPVAGAILGLLGISTLLLIAAQILQATLVALNAHFAVTLSWQIGTTVLIAVLFLPTSAIGGAVAAQLASSLVVVLAMTWTLIHRLRGGACAQAAQAASG